tara:strand:+ start:259 stop:486 length:228 start_codon:yes stop_codon:yes gene_type:complete
VSAEAKQSLNFPILREFIVSCIGFGVMRPTGQSGKFGPLGNRRLSAFIVPLSYHYLNLVLGASHLEEKVSAWDLF